MQGVGVHLAKHPIQSKDRQSSDQMLLHCLQLQHCLASAISHARLRTSQANTCCKDKRFQPVRCFVFSCRLRHCKGKRLGKFLHCTSPDQNRKSSRISLPSSQKKLFYPRYGCMHSTHPTLENDTPLTRILSTVLSSPTTVHVRPKYAGCDRHGGFICISHFGLKYPSTIHGMRSLSKLCNVLLSDGVL